MANFVYSFALEDFGKGLIDWLSDDIKCVVCSSAYTANQVTDHYLSAIAAGARLATSANMANKSMSLGVADCDNFLFSGFNAASDGTQLVWYVDSGNPSTSILLCRYDTMPGLPVVPQGADVLVVVPNDANKLFKL